MKWFKDWITNGDIYIYNVQHRGLMLLNKDNTENLELMNTRTILNY